MKLVWPSADYLPSYRSALERRWSADTLRPEACAEELAKVWEDPQTFLAGLNVRDPQGQTVTLPDGSKVPRLPGCQRWMWDGEFCGSIGLRWQKGTSELPLHCLGHIGYAVVPWKQRRGYASKALGLLLPEAKAEGLSYVEITTDPGNLASQRVIEANGGCFTSGSPSLRSTVASRGCVIASHFCEGQILPSVETTSRPLNLLLWR